MPKHRYPGGYTVDDITFRRAARQMIRDAHAARTVCGKCGASPSGKSAIEMWDPSRTFEENMEIQRRFPPVVIETYTVGGKRVRLCGRCSVGLESV